MAEAHPGAPAEGHDYDFAAERERAAGVLRLSPAEVESIGHYGGRAILTEPMAARREVESLQHSGLNGPARRSPLVLYPLVQAH